MPEYKRHRNKIAEAKTKVTNEKESRFLLTRNIGNVGIDANFVFPYFPSLLVSFAASKSVIRYQ